MKTNVTGTVVYTPTEAVLGHEELGKAISRNDDTGSYAVLTKDRLWFHGKHLRCRRGWFYTHKRATEGITLESITQVRESRCRVSLNLIVGVILAVLAVVCLLTYFEQTMVAYTQLRDAPSPDPFTLALLLPFIIIASFALLFIYEGFLVQGMLFALLAVAFFRQHWKVAGKVLLVQTPRRTFGVALKHLPKAEVEAFREALEGKETEKPSTPLLEIQAKDIPVYGVLGRSRALSGGKDFALLTEDGILCYGKDLNAPDTVMLSQVVAVVARKKPRILAILGKVVFGSLFWFSLMWTSFFAIAFCFAPLLMIGVVFFPLSGLILMMVNAAVCWWLRWLTGRASYKKEVVIVCQTEQIVFPIEDITPEEIWKFDRAVANLQKKNQEKDGIAFRHQPEFTRKILI